MSRRNVILVPLLISGKRKITNGGRVRKGRAGQKSLKKVIFEQPLPVTAIIIVGPIDKFNGGRRNGYPP